MWLEVTYAPFMKPFNVHATSSQLKLLIKKQDRSYEYYVKLLVYDVVFVISFACSSKFLNNVRTFVLISFYYYFLTYIPLNFSFCLF